MVIEEDKTYLIAEKLSNRERGLWKRNKMWLHPRKKPEQIGSCKNSQREIPARSSRKLRVNGIAKVPAERSGLTPPCSRGVPRPEPDSVLPPWATSLEVEWMHSSHYACTMLPFKQTMNMQIQPKRGEKLKVRSSKILPRFPSTHGHYFWEDVLLKAAVEAEESHTMQLIPLWARARTEEADDTSRRGGYASRRGGLSQTKWGYKWK